MTSIAGQLHHIEIYVSDLQRSIEFWQWFLNLLNYKKFQQRHQGISFKLSNTYIVFVQTEEKYMDVQYHRCRVGLNHLAFHAESRHQVDEITEKLKERKIKILYADRHPFAGGGNYYSISKNGESQYELETFSPFFRLVGVEIQQPAREQSKGQT